MKLVLASKQGCETQVSFLTVAAGLYVHLKLTLEIVVLAFAGEQAPPALAAAFAPEIPEIEVASTSAATEITEDFFIFPPIGLWHDSNDWDENSSAKARSIVDYLPESFVIYADYDARSSPFCGLTDGNRSVK